MARARARSGLPIMMSRKWRMPMGVWGLFIAELVFTVPALALFAIAQPNLYRDKLRTFGSDRCWNSSLMTQVYNAANYRPLNTPPAYSQFTTDYNVVISVLAMFVLLVKAVMFIMHIFWPIIGFLSHGALVGLWGYSLYLQVAPDISDAHCPQSGAPWYITRGCSVVQDGKLKGYCMQAQASLAVTVIMLTLFFLNTALAIWSIWPTKEYRERKQRERDEISDIETEENHFDFPPPPQTKEGKAWEMHQYPTTPGYIGGMKSPMTPRTTAFNQLAGGPPSSRKNDLPLRSPRFA